MNSNSFRIQLPLVNEYKTLFEIEKENYENQTYDTFKNSYLNRCSDQYISRLASSLNTKYNNIENAYYAINSFWSDYNLNIKGLEDSLKTKTLSSELMEDEIISFVTKNMCSFPILTKNLDVFLNNNYVVSLTSDDKIIESEDILLEELTGSEVANSTDSVISSVAESEVNSIKNYVLDFLNSSACFVTFGASIVEGAGKFLEGLVDTALMAATGVASIGTEVVDLIAGTSYTDEMWAQTKAIVSKEL